MEFSQKSSHKIKTKACNYSMLDFHKPTENDKEWVDSLLKDTEYFGCFYSFATVFLWSDVYGSEIACYGNAWLIRGGDKNNDLHYMYPAGKEYDIKEIIPILREDAASFGQSLVIACAEKWQCEELNSAFPDEFRMEDDRDDYDYIYLSDNLVNLKGKKFHAKRNHISKFIRSYPDWQFESISDENAVECIEAATMWLEKSLPEVDSDEQRHLCFENSAIAYAVRNREALGMIGGLLRVDGKVIAMTIGEPLNSRVFVTHFEKADTEHDGAYAMINNQFAINSLSGYEYINREEDLGLEGLRKSKLSYYPDILLEKFMLYDKN